MDSKDYLKGHTAKEVEFFRRELGMKKQMKILDLGCGSGRISLPLAKLGLQVVGVDSAVGFLDIARAAAKREGVAIRFILQDNRELTFDREFDRVILAHSTFGYFDDADKRILDNMARALKPGGLVCFDISGGDLNFESRVNAVPTYLRLQSPDEIRMTLEASGLRLLSLYSSWDGSRVKSGSGELIVVGKKGEWNG